MKSLFNNGVLYLLGLSFSNVKIYLIIWDQIIKEITNGTNNLSRHCSCKWQRKRKLGVCVLVGLEQQLQFEDWHVLLRRLKKKKKASPWKSPLWHARQLNITLHSYLPQGSLNNSCLTHPHPTFSLSLSDRFSFSTFWNSALRLFRTFDHMCRKI